MFEGLGYYPVGPAMRFELLTLGPPPKRAEVETHVQTSDGAVRHGQRVGTLRFNIDGREQQLVALRLVDALCLLMSSATSGELLTTRITAGDPQPLVPRQNAAPVCVARRGIHRAAAGRSCPRPHPGGTWPRHGHQEELLRPLRMLARDPPHDRVPESGYDQRHGETPDLTDPLRGGASLDSPVR